MFSKYLVVNVTVGVLFIVDRLIKFWFFKNPSFSWDFMAGILGFSLSLNQGIAFGLVINEIVVLTLITIILFILIDLLLKAYWQKNILIISAISLIIGGAISNLVDRLRYGFVIDYINVPFFTVFNLADIMISGGVAVLLIILLIKKDKPDQLDKQPKIL